MKSFLGNFYRHSATFYWSHCSLALALFHSRKITHAMWYPPNSLIYCTLTLSFFLSFFLSFALTNTFLGTYQRDGIYRAGIIYRNLFVSSQHSTFNEFQYILILSTQHLNPLYMPMDLVFVLKQVKSVTGCTLYIFHLSGTYTYFGHSVALVTFYTILSLYMDRIRSIYCLFSSFSHSNIKFNITN